MVAKLLNFLHDLIKISDQSTGQVHLIGKASYVVTTFSGYHHSINSLTGLAQKVTILLVLHLVIFFVMRYIQCFSCSIVHFSLKRPPRSDSLNHLADTADTISHRLLIDDDPHVQEIGVPTK
jgi:hypothetical protein